MVIHSVTPAHLLRPADELPAGALRDMGGFLLEGTDTPEGFRLARLHSTDPAMYLDSKYSPGSIVPGRHAKPNPR